jgi:Protein of unknown function (DUF2924)
MPRVVIDPTVPDRELLDNEIARLRGLDIEELRARWHTAFPRRAPPHLTRHLLFRILAYRLQADRLGELDNDSRRLLDRIGAGSAERIDRLVLPICSLRAERLLLMPNNRLKSHKLFSTPRWKSLPHRERVGVRG